jgi:hypothetical protein
VFGSRGVGAANWDDVKNDDISQPGWDDSAYWDSFLYTQRYFVEECIGKGLPPLSTIDDALAARVIIDAAIESLERRGYR